MMAGLGAAFGNSSQLKLAELSFDALRPFWLVIRLV
jgi:hypothetical protein